MPRSRIAFCAQVGNEAHSSAGGRSFWMTKTPPLARPASGLEWRKTLGSGDSTTSTCFSSQLTRIGSWAKTP